MSFFMQKWKDIIDQRSGYLALSIKQGGHSEHTIKVGVVIGKVSEFY